MPRRHIPLLIALSLLCLAAPGAHAEAPAGFVESIVTIVMESTPAWGSAEDMVTDRVVLTPATGQVLRVQVHADSGQVQGSETYTVPPEWVANLAEVHLPGLLAWPVWEGDMALDGWYIYLTVHFEGDYSMRFGGHVADELGPPAFREACAAVRAILVEAETPAE